MKTFHEMWYNLVEMHPLMSIAYKNEERKEEDTSSSSSADGRGW